MTTVRKNADVREKEIRLAIFRIEVAKLASINEMLEIENRTLTAKCGNPRISSLPFRAL
jgi:hypothetical protein